MPVTRSPSGRLSLGGVDLAALARDSAVATPTYVYDLGAIVAEAQALSLAFESAPHLVAYAVKANSAGPIVRALARAGCGADVVSGAELAVALASGVRPDAVVFSGVAKQDDEIDAAIAAGAGTDGPVLQIESVEEIARVAARAKSGRQTARVALRVNPAASLEDLATHVHIATGHDEAKFGVSREDLGEALALVEASSELTLAGLSTHVGSQFTTTTPYVEAARTLFEIVRTVRGAYGHRMRFVDTGGGFGVDYGGGQAASPADFVRETRALMRTFGLDDLALYVEPGRALVAAHGVLLAKVVQEKVTPRKVGPNDPQRRWLMIDAGMNDLLRPALYQAHHRVVLVEPSTGPDLPWRVVGPVCESADDFGEHPLPRVAGEAGRIVAILDAGAYGYAMASRYNGRALPSEVFVRDGEVVARRPRDPRASWSDERTNLGA